VWRSIFKLPSCSVCGSKTETHEDVLTAVRVFAASVGHVVSIEGARGDVSPFVEGGAEQLMVHRTVKV